MTHRERLIACLKGEKADRPPDYEFGAWKQTFERWRKEGLPPLPEKADKFEVLDRFFRTDGADTGSGIPVEVGLFPRFDPTILHEQGDHLIFRDDEGVICEMLRPELGASIPKYLKYPIESRADWQRMRDERLDPEKPGRLPDNIDDLCKESFYADYPVIVFVGSLYGWIRNWMGVERLSVTIYDDPEWIGEMMEHLTVLTLKVLEKIAGRCKIDVAHWWEDMCFNKGPLMSPKHVAQFMLPRYKRVTEFLRKECECNFNSLDCDGNIHSLVKLWLDNGISVMLPLEVPHTDAYRIRKEFGKEVLLRGYFDKRALIEGEEAIDREFERILPLINEGGFIPHTDHCVPPDVSLENFCYYRKRKCEILGKTFEVEFSEID